MGRGALAMTKRDEFAKADQQVAELKKRIARQRDILERAMQRDHPTAAAESTLRTLEGSLRIFEKHRQAIFDRQEAKQQSPTPPKLNHNLQPEGLRALE
jgi:hypothetical protein